MGPSSSVFGSSEFPKSICIGHQPGHVGLSFGKWGTVLPRAETCQHPVFLPLRPPFPGGSTDHLDAGDNPLGFFQLTGILVLEDAEPNLPEGPFALAESPIFPDGLSQ